MPIAGLHDAHARKFRQCRDGCIHTPRRNVGVTARREFRNFRTLRAVAPSSNVQDTSERKVEAGTASYGLFRRCEPVDHAGMGHIRTATTVCTSAFAHRFLPKESLTGTSRQQRCLPSSPRHPPLHASCALTGQLDTYVFARSYRTCEETINSGHQRTLQRLLHRRRNARQQEHRWSPRGASLKLKVRTATANGTFDRTMTPASARRASDSASRLITPASGRGFGMPRR
jgi:hypothetical protein